MISDASEIHPYFPFIPDKAAVLFVGSFPPIRLIRKTNNYSSDPLTTIYNSYLTRNRKRGKDIDFYYGTSDNYFWKILAEIFQKQLDNKEAIIRFLEMSDIGITDVAEVIIRKLLDTESGRYLLPDKIAKPYDKYRVSSSDTCIVIQKPRDIISVILKYNYLQRILFAGRLAYQSFRKYLPSSIIIQNNVMDIDNRKIRLIQLPSSSGAANISIGACQDYKRIKKENPNYTIFNYRVDIYRSALKPLL